MTRCRDEVMKALEGFLPTLRKAIEERTNTNKETQALKELRTRRNQQGAAIHGTPGDEAQRREEEKELWETIKVRSMTRMLAAAYAQCILFLVVTVQVNLLGGRLFEEQLQNTSSTSSMSIDSVASDRMSAYGESHKLVLQHTYKYFFERGIFSLLDSVERAVNDVLQNWNVSDPSSLNISRESFDRAINDIRAAEERGRISSRIRRPRSLLRFLLPPSESFDENVSDELARWILDETWDLLESPVLQDAQQDCLKATFERMRDHYWGKIFEDQEEVAEMPRHAASRSVTRPLAHVVTRLKHTSKSFFKTQPASAVNDSYILGGSAPRFTVNSYCAEMETLPSVLELQDVSFN
jgi:peroxin-3